MYANALRPAAVAICFCLFATVLVAQAPLPPPNSFAAPYAHATGVVSNTGTHKSVIDRHVVRVVGAPTLRIHFVQVTLGPEDYIEILAPQDGEVHRLDAQELVKWRDYSGHFNGGELQVDLVLAPGSTGSYAIDEVIVGLPLALPESICFGTDDRMPSSDSRVARMMPIGCTMWLAGANDCAISAGHCFNSSGAQSAHFNIPPSLSNGALQNPPIQDQYPIDQSTVQFVDGGVGNDYGACTVLPNNLGQSASSNQGFFGLSFAIPALGTTTRITGYGTSSGVVNQVQQTHAGPLVVAGGPSGTELGYQVDTTGGNSGSPVIDAVTGAAVGVHTHAGCNSSGNNNSGTSLVNAGFQALVNSICTPGPQPQAGYPGGSGKTLDCDGVVGPGYCDTLINTPVTWTITDNGVGGGSILVVGTDFAAGFFPVPIGCAAPAPAIDLANPVVAADGVAFSTGTTLDFILAQPSVVLGLTFDCSYAGVTGPGFQAVYVDPSCTPFQFELTAAIAARFQGGAATTVYNQAAFGAGNGNADDGWIPHSLAAPITYGGASYGTVYLGSNGQITFGAGDGSFAPAPADFSAGWQASPTTVPNPGVAYWGDFNRSTQTGDTTVIESSCGGSATVRIEYNNQQWWDSQGAAGSWSFTFGKSGGFDAVVADVSGALDGLVGTDQYPILGVTDGDDTVGTDYAANLNVDCASGYTATGRQTIWEQFGDPLGTGTWSTVDLSTCQFIDLGPAYVWMLAP